ncbi:hypothetical protein MRB53_035087 [Persea americana]|uniref:Uncharacterized protein n=1 Tax=Persea americana TaxID=3435 RepID=A0ACC2K3P8_PERAE|nr:hypothetical protein MRB53_035087 [Persea americana]
MDSSVQSTINPNTGYCPATKTFHSIRPTIPLPSPTLPLTSASYAFSLCLSSSSSNSFSDSVSTVPALIDSATSLRISYSQFFDRVQILSSFLQTHFPFLTNGQVAFVLSPSTVHVPVLNFSLLSLGVVVSPSNPASTASEISRQIQLSSSVIAFATSSTSHKLRSSLPTLLLDSPLFLSLFSSSSSSSSSSDAPRHRHRHHLLGPTSVRQSDPAAILYSSGTTGNVKGVVLTHRNLISMLAGSYALRTSGAAPAVALLTVPMFHVYGFISCLRSAALGEVMVVMEGRFEVGRMLRAVEEFRVTRVVLAPPVVVVMARGEVAEGYDLRSLQVVGCGGAPLAMDVIERFTSRFPNIQLVQAYGLTESTARAFQIIGPEESKCYGSAGRILPYCQAKIVHPVTGIALPPCSQGELWIRGPMIMKGYIGDEAATAAAINSEGWLKTGDLCYIDNDGFLFVVDRLKELIKYKGYQVPPAELEHLLLSHPEIIDAAVIPYPDEEAGQVPMAFVVRQPQSALCEAQIIDFVAKQVAPYKKIRRVSFISSIPKNPTGKLLRKDLIKLATSISPSPRL